MRPATAFTKTVVAIALSTLLFACGKNQEEQDAKTQAIADAAAQKAVAASDEKHEKELAATKADSDSKLANLKSEMESKLADEKAKLQEQIASQAKELKTQYTASNDALRSQLDSLTAKYNSLKDKLPDNISSALEAKLPELKSSLSNLEGIVSKFSPSSLEQLKELQTKYETELAVAKKVADEILALLGKGSVDSFLPKL